MIHLFDLPTETRLLIWHYALIGQEKKNTISPFPAWLFEETPSLALAPAKRATALRLVNKALNVEISEVFFNTFTFRVNGHDIDEADLGGPCHVVGSLSAITLSNIRKLRIIVAIDALENCRPTKAVEGHQALNKMLVSLQFVEFRFHFPFDHYVDIYSPHPVSRDHYAVEDALSLVQPYRVARRLEVSLHRRYHVYRQVCGQRQRMSKEQFNRNMAIYCMIEARILARDF